MFSSSMNFVDLELIGLNGFEVQRETERLKSAMIEKERVDEDWLFLAMERLRDGWDDELEEHMQRDDEFFVHSVIGGRF